MIIAADNDAFSEQNTGKIKAEESAKQHNCSVILPKFKKYVKSEVATHNTLIATR